MVHYHGDGEDGGYYVTPANGRAKDWGFRVWAFVAMVALAALALFSLSACASFTPEQAAKAVESLDNQAKAQQETIARLDAAASVAELSPEQAQAIADAKAQAKAALDAANAAKALTVSFTTNKPQDIVSGVTETVAPFIPEPYRSPVVIAGSLAAAIWRAAKWKAAATSIVDSVEKARVASENFGKAMNEPAVVQAMQSKQTDAAARLVDSVQGRSLGLLGAIDAKLPL